MAQDLSDFKKLEEFLTLAKTIDVFKSCQDIFDVFGIKDKNASLYDIQIQIDSFVSKWSGSNAPKYVILGRRVEGDAEVFKRVLKEKRPAYNDYLFENHPKIKELQIHFKAYTKDGELDEIEKQNLIDEAVSSDLPEGKFLLLIERWLLEAGVREVQSSSTASSATTTSEFDLFLKLTCYEQLGVSEKADYAAIKDAFEKAYSRYNGLGASKKGIESAKFERMQAAYEILKDPRKRRDYDELLAQGPPPIEGDPILKVERKSNLEYTFKNIRKGTDLKETIAIKNPGGGLLQGSIRSDVPWIEPDRDKILKQHEQNLVIRILTSKIPAKVYKASGFVTIETNAPIAGKHEIPITVFLENYEIELQRFQKTYIPLVISFFGLIGSFFGLLKLIIFAGASGGISFFLSKLVLDHCQNKGIDLSKYPAALAHSLTCGMVALTFIINGNSLFNQGSPIPSQPKTSSNEISKAVVAPPANPKKNVPEIKIDKAVIALSLDANKNPVDIAKSFLPGKKTLYYSVSYSGAIPKETVFMFKWYKNGIFINQNPFTAVYQSGSVFSYFEYDYQPGQYTVGVSAYDQQLNTTSFMINIAVENTPNVDDQRRNHPEKSIEIVEAFAAQGFDESLKQPVGRSSSFTSGIQKIFYIVTLKNTKSSATLRYKIFKNGALLNDTNNKSKIGDGVSYSWSMLEANYTPGEYSVKIFLENEYQISFDFTVRSSNNGNLSVMDINSDTKKLINKNESYLPSNPRTEEKIKVSSNDTSITAQPLISKRIENKNERPIQNGKKDQLTTKNYKNDIDAFAPPKENF